MQLKKFTYLLIVTLCSQKDLFNVLKAYSIRDPSVGYCQAQAPIAAFLLMHMPAEDAFWCLYKICKKYLHGYYSQGMVSFKCGNRYFLRIYYSFYAY